jgi:periplasmic protein CpxP/Spy
MTIVRFVVPVALILGFAIADGVLAPALAQETNTGQAAEGQTAPTPALDQTAARIKYLHDRLRIAAEQEPLWGVVAQAIRESTEGLAPLRREQFRATANGTALELLHSDEALGDAQLGSLKKIIAAFDPLYEGLSDNQKKIADAILREGAQNAMISGVPFVPPPFSSSLLYPSVWGGPSLPLLVHRPVGFHHFHGLFWSRPHVGRFHR